LVATGLLVIPALLAALGFAPLPAMRALWEGSLGSFYALSSGTLVRATPLILTGLSVAIAFRAGVFNIGAEGQLLAGAAAAAAIGVVAGGSLGAFAPAVELLAGVVAGALWAGIAAVLRARFGVLEVISTILLNFIAAYLVAYLVRGPLQEPLHIYPQSSSLVESARLPRIIPGTRLHAGFPLALAAATAVWWVVRATAAGFRLRVVGANPDAARVAGEIDATRTAARAFLASGALAGLAGAIELTGVTFALYENLSPGYGYSGIAVALLARLNPLGVIASGVVFGALESGASAMQRDAGVPSVVVSIAEAVIIVLLVLLWRRPVERGGSVAVGAVATTSAALQAER
jgi:simple sugar transport system permease protein